MEIRPARPADAPAVAAVARASWHAAYDDLLGADTVTDTVAEWYDVDSLRESTGTGVFLVAERAGDVRGFAHAVASPDPDDPADAFLARLYVHPDAWGAGLGTRLLRATAARLLDAGHDAVWLEVFAGNDVGVGFYEARGFERVDSVAETFGGTDVETLHLRAALDDLVD